jgi:hypothetical protein
MTDINKIFWKSGKVTVIANGIGCSIATPYLEADGRVVMVGLNLDATAWGPSGVGLTSIFDR